MTEKPLAEWFQEELDKYKADYCPICNTEKVRRVEYYETGYYMRTRKTKIVSIDYELDAGEKVLTVYCPRCLLLFEAVE